VTVGISHLRHISLRTSAFDESVEYYQGPWGLEIVDTDTGVAALRGTGTEHHVLQLTAADANGLDRLSFAVHSARAIDGAAEVLSARGVTLATEPDDIDGPGGGYVFTFADLEGRPVQFSTSVEAVPPKPLGSTPAKIAHVVLNSVDIDAAQAWWCEVLGFKVSDWSEHQMVFLRCNADHHSIAFNQADKTSVNHVAYEVPSLDAFMMSLGRLNRAGHQPGWGPGRHGPGNNAFSYFVDPAGMVPEVTAEVQQIDDATWVPRVWRRVPELSDLWGTAGPPSENIRSHMAG
jgi:catechol-2,3-dioxygenase